MAAVRTAVSSTTKLSRTLVWGRWMLSTAVSAPTTSPPPPPFLPLPALPHVASLSIRPRHLKAALRDQNPTAIRSILMAVKSVREPLPLTFYNALLTACAKEGNAQVARDVYILMRLQGVLPNATSHTRFCRALCRSGHLAEALEHVEGLTGRGGGSLSAFNAILNACGHARNQQMADRCLAAMQRQGVVPTPQTHAELMKLAGAVGDVAGVHRSWRQVARVEEQPSVVACSAHVLALASCQDLTGAVQALENLGQAAIRELKGMKGGGGLEVEVIGGGTSIADTGGSRGGGGWWADPSATLLSVRAKEEVVRSYNQVLNLVAMRGEADTTSLLVAQMHRGGLVLDSYGYNAWMRAAAKQGQVDTVLKVWRHMSRAGIPPTRHSHEARLMALCKGGRVEEAEEALGGMGEEASAHGFNAVMQAWADRGKSSQAFATYRAMKREGLRPDRCTFLALLAASAGPRAVGLTPGEWAEEEVATRIEYVETEMEREGLQHGPKTVTAVIQAYGQEGMVGAMVERLRGWQGLGLLGEAAYNAAISACGKHKQMDVAQELFQEMATDGVEPSVVTFNAVINGCSYGGEVGMALEVLEEMRGRGLTADVCTYNSLIKVACHCGDMDMALEVMGDMEGDGVKGDEQTYETLMAGAGHNKRMDVMEYVVEHMHRERAPPTSFVCAELVGGYVEMGQVEEAVAAIRVLGYRMHLSEGQNRSGNVRAMGGEEGRMEAGVGGDAESEDGDGGDGDGGDSRKILENVVEGGGEVGLGRYLMGLGEEVDNEEGEGSCEESGWAVRLKTNYDRL